MQEYKMYTKNKLLLFTIIAFVAVVFASCGGQKNYYSSKASGKGCGCPSQR